jgi:hypothetical protein
MNKKPNLEGNFNYHINEKAFNFNKHFKDAKTIKINIAANNSQQELQAASVSLEEKEGDRNYVRAVHVEKGGLLKKDLRYYDHDIEMPDVKNLTDKEKNSQNTKKGTNFEEYLKNNFLRDFSPALGPDPPDLIINNKIAEFNPKFAIINYYISKRIFLEAKTSYNNRIFFSAKSYGNIRPFVKTLFLKALTSKEDVQITNNMGRDILTTYVFAENIFDGLTEFVLMAYNEKEKYIQVRSFNLKEFNDDLAKASFSISKTDAGASLVLKMGQTQILRFELRDAKNSLENDVEIKSLMDFNSFATKLRDTNGFKLNSKEDQQEFFNFLSHGRYPEGKIQSLKNYLAIRSETTIKVESKVNNKIVFCLQNGNIPNGKIEFNVEIITDEKGLHLDTK